MILTPHSVFRLIVIALLAGASAPAWAQERDSFLGGIFGRSEQNAPVTMAQMAPTDLVVRLDRLENQIRQLTGAIEQLQFRNQQLEAQLKRMHEDVDYRFQEQGKGTGRPLPSRTQQLPAPSPAPPPAVALPNPSAQPLPGGPLPGQPGRRSDVFDPNDNPNAPGAPRTLGSLPVNPRAGEARIYSTDPMDDDDDMIEPRIGVPGGRSAGSPLDLSTLSDVPQVDPRSGPAGSSVAALPSPGPSGSLPPPPPRNPSATGAHASVLPPSATPKDEYDLAYGYMLRKDYALAEEELRSFLRKYPTNERVADASYWLGESLFQRQRYRDAAETFLTVSTKFDKSPKAPEALLRLAQSLAALKERDAACATFAEVGRKFPRASASVQQAADREQKRARCS